VHALLNVVGMSPPFSMFEITNGTIHW
jgi:hypothetical protein